MFVCLSVNCKEKLAEMQFKYKTVMKIHANVLSPVTADCPQVRIDRLNTHWTSSLSVGVLAADKFSLAVSAVSLKQPCWVVQDSSVFHSGIKVRHSKQGSYTQHKTHFQFPIIAMNTC